MGLKSRYLRKGTKVQIMHKTRRQSQSQRQSQRQRQRQRGSGGCWGGICSTNNPSVNETAHSSRRDKVQVQVPTMTTNPMIISTSVRPTGLQQPSVLPLGELERLKSIWESINKKFEFEHKQISNPNIKIKPTVIQNILSAHVQDEKATYKTLYYQFYQTFIKMDVNDTNKDALINMFYNLIRLPTFNRLANYNQRLNEFKPDQTYEKYGRKIYGKMTTYNQMNFFTNLQIRNIEDNVHNHVNGLWNSTRTRILRPWPRMGESVEETVGDGGGGESPASSINSVNMHTEEIDSSMNKHREIMNILSKPIFPVIPVSEENQRKMNAELHALRR